MVSRRQFVHRDVEEALNLTGVQVHRQDAVGARRRDAIRQQTRRDRHARLILLVGAAIGVVGDDGGDALGRGALEGVDHDEEFEDRGADGELNG